jgi:large subunit ribosomal protein L16
MGKGKAETEFWAAVIKPGTVLYEIAGVPEDLAREAFSRIAHKMPVRVRMIGRRHTV